MPKQEQEDRPQIGEILADFEQDHDEVKAVKSILVELLIVEKQASIKALKKVDIELPKYIEDERKMVDEEEMELYLYLFNGNKAEVMRHLNTLRNGHNSCRSQVKEIIKSNIKKYEI